MGKKLGERLIEAGLLGAGSVEQALAHQKIVGHRLGDCLVELGLLPEATVLRVLAVELGTKFVTAEKLAKAKIAPEVLDRVPVRLAESQLVIPVALDFERKVVSVVMAEPQNQTLLKELKAITEQNEVFAFIGSRQAISAAIRRNYYGDPTAFAGLDHGGAGALPLKPEPVTAAPVKEDSQVAAPPAERSGAQRSASSQVSQVKAPTQLREALGAVRAAVGENDFVETLNIMVGLLEMPRKEFRAHSAQVARQAVAVARRLDLPPRDVGHVAIAAYLHDLGKRPDVHFTLAALANDLALRTEATRYLRAPIKLFETVHLPPAVNTILAHLYEAFDGTGIPQGVAGDEIPVGARILAAVDALFDFTHNPANPAQGVLSREDAVAHLTEQAGRLYDPRVVTVLAHTQTGELLLRRLENDGRTVVVADGDDRTRAELQDALARAGLVAQAVTRLDGVVEALHAGEADAIAVGLGFGAGDIGTLVEYLRGRGDSAAIPIYVVGEPTEAPARSRLLDAGINGFIATPLAAETAAQLLKQAVQERIAGNGPGHPVRGSFDELPAKALATLIGEKKKWGRLVVKNGPLEGALTVENGRVVHAVFGNAQKEPAIAEALHARQAEFTWEPEGLPLDVPDLDVDLAAIARTL